MNIWAFTSHLQQKNKMKKTSYVKNSKCQQPTRDIILSRPSQDNQTDISLTIYTLCLSASQKSQKNSLPMLVATQLPCIYLFIQSSPLHVRCFTHSHNVINFSICCTWCKSHGKFCRWKFLQCADLKGELHYNQSWAIVLHNMSKISTFQKKWYISIRKQETQKLYWNFSRSSNTWVIDPNNNLHILINISRTSWPTEI